MRNTVTDIIIPVIEKTVNTAGTFRYSWNPWDTKYHKSQVVPTATPPRADMKEPHGKKFTENVLLKAGSFRVALIPTAPVKHVHIPSTIPKILSIENGTKYTAASAMLMPKRKSPKMI